MKTARIVFGLVLLAGLALAQEIPVMPYDSLMEDRVSADGCVEREDEYEYPAELKNPATGITVSWGFDDSLMYLALETRGKGWFGIGFGSPVMNESNMIIGFYTDDSAEVYNMVGKEHSHTPPIHVDSLLLDWDIDFDDETGVTAFEVIYPLKWHGEGAPETFAPAEFLKEAAIPGLAPGDLFDLILAQNTKSVSFMAKHTHRAGLKFKLAENPHVVSEEGE